MADRETRRYVITGRVQGVGFRWFVEREATRLASQAGYAIGKMAASK